MSDFDGMTPDAVARFIAGLKAHPEGITPMRTPLRDRLAREPAKGIVHKFPPITGWKP